MAFPTLIVYLLLRNVTYKKKKLSLSLVTGIAGLFPCGTLTMLCFVHRIALVP